jgi:hypothetical protein
MLEDNVEEEDFVREVMKLLLTDQGQEQWSERVANLYGGQTTWRQFSQSLADALGLQGGRRDDGTNHRKSTISWMFWLFLTCSPDDPQMRKSSAHRFRC